MKKRLLQILFLLIAILCSNLSFAQKDTITITGKVSDKENPFVRINFFVLNKRTGEGNFGDHKGNFTIKALRSDTLRFSAKGYYAVKMAVKDSTLASATSCEVNIALQPHITELKPVEIFPERELTEITKDIRKLKDPRDIELVTANVIESPLTALYQAFSKMERSKHQVAVMEAEDRKREVLKELLSRYVKADIIDLTEEQFDEFLSYCNFDIYYIRSLTEYELIIHVKQCFERYKHPYYIDKK